MGNWIPIFFLLSLLSCGKSVDSIGYKTISDQKNIFSLEVPKNFTVEIDTTNFTSAVFFSDGTLANNEKATFGVIFNEWKLPLDQEHAEQIINESINNLGVKRLSGSFGKVNNFDYYKLQFEDNHNNSPLGRYETHYLMSEKDEAGHLVFSIQRHTLGLKVNDSILTQNILKSIKWKD